VLWDDLAAVAVQALDVGQGESRGNLRCRIFSPGCFTRAWGCSGASLWGVLKGMHGSFFVGRVYGKCHPLTAVTKYWKGVTFQEIRVEKNKAVLKECCDVDRTLRVVLNEGGWLHGAIHPCVCMLHAGCSQPGGCGLDRNPRLRLSLHLRTPALLSKALISLAEYLWYL
jgi:hypothetical protein